jgi:LemA protein
MKKAIAGLGIVLGIVFVGAAVLFLMFIGLRNKLVLMEEDVDNQWAQVEVEYQRRYDLIPKLVNSVKGAMEQEQKIFGDIAEARTRYAETQEGSQERVEAANDLESSLSRLLVIMENYPELKSNETVQDLMTQLEGTENRISVERRRYNDLVTDFNKRLRVFPNNLINDWFLNFEEKERFEAVEGAETAPEVDLSTDNGDGENSSEENNSSDSNTEDDSNSDSGNDTEN